MGVGWDGVGCGGVDLVPWWLPMNEFTNLQKVPTLFQAPPFWRRGVQQCQVFNSSRSLHDSEPWPLEMRATIRLMSNRKHIFRFASTSQTQQPKS